MASSPHWLKSSEDESAAGMSAFWANATPVRNKLTAVARNRKRIRRGNNLRFRSRAVERSLLAQVGTHFRRVRFIVARGVSGKVVGRLGKPSLPGEFHFGVFSIILR